LGTSKPGSAGSLKTSRFDEIQDLIQALRKDRGFRRPTLRITTGSDGARPPSRPFGTLPFGGSPLRPTAVGAPRAVTYPLPFLGVNDPFSPARRATLGTSQRSTQLPTFQGSHHTNEPGHRGTSNNLKSWSIANQHVEGINPPSDHMILASRDQAGPVAPDKQVPCFQREHGQDGTKGAAYHGKSSSPTTWLSRKIDA
jgi:hypothetical protein